MKGVLDSLILAFLLFNLVIRFGTIFSYPPYNRAIAGLLGVVAVACAGAAVWPRHLKHVLFIFGFSFFLFGFGSIDIQSRIFELIVTVMATTLFVANHRASEPPEVNRALAILLLCYVGLSLFSLLLLPVTQILGDFKSFGFPDFFFYLFIGPAYGSYYPISAVIQLALFVCLAVELSLFVQRVELYRFLFSGIFSGAVFCAFIGLLDFYGVISLAWYRFGETGTAGVLHSTFQNRNCFGEFVLTVIPFVMIGFLSRIRGVWWKVFLFGCLVICEIALILAGGRAGWIIYPLVLFICWLFFYFSREGRLKSFRFRWKDFAKVTISVPVTIGISLMLLFYVLMPLGDQMKAKPGITGINTGSNRTSDYLKSQIERIGEMDAGSRDRTWGQGLSVGRESPLFGLGYESFYLQAHILDKIPGSYFHQFRSQSERIFESPHNVLLSTFVSGGVVGLLFWLLIIGYAIVLMVFDLSKNKSLMNIAVIISIISFHMYGMSQSMQYIPMIWLLVFLCLGYAMTIDEAVLPDWLRRRGSVLTKASVVLMVVGLLVYLGNLESRGLAEKYGLRIWAMDQDQDRFAGFHQPSQRWTYGEYRWSGKGGAIYLPGGGPVELEFHCMTPGMENEPVTVTVSHQGKVLDRIVFGAKREEQGANSKGKRPELKAESVRRRYELPKTPGEEQRLDLEVSRTWVPHAYRGNFDRRELGVGVKLLR